MKLLLVLITLIIAALANNSLRDPLAPPARHAGHLAGAPRLRGHDASRNVAAQPVYSAAEERLQQCRAHLD
ncbi:hypothetical protein [Dasychira pudibunda nucleopolyhedrovirus]|nr:hypothetical protein [Dasychira pudibunda nucleopolyhedrovirus]WHM28337.1 hypothetical protein [Dasychira pudibunda nucleopolyhedrovirus]